MKISIIEDECVVCCSCVDMCESNALLLRDDRIFFDEQSCTECKMCLRICPFDLISEDKKS